MRRLLTGLVLGATAVMISLPANAGILLEPYLGYETGTQKSSTSSDNYSVMGFGARVGYTLPLVWFGLDYSTGSGKLKSSGTDYDITGTNLFADVGIAIPLLRAWFGYGLQSTLTEKTAGGDAKITGDIMKIGAGFTGLPFIAINVEYLMYTPKKQTYGGVESTLSGMSGTGLMLSVSAPFDF